MASTQVPFDRFVKHAELTELLQRLAADHPELVEVTSIGTSHEGREIWLVTVTNTATGPHNEKPAFWVDANIHATELTGSVAALHLVHRLATGYGDDDRVTRALDTRCFYVVPRLNPDGAELALADRPTYVRSSVRHYPKLEQEDGLVAEDVDGDGRMLTMRVPDPNGPWKAYGEDPRLLVAREPDEAGPGPYWRLLPEGRIENYDGILVTGAPPLMGLDMNRNFPIEWRPENEQRGAGPYPTSEPEIRAVVQAIVERQNICGYIAYHTAAGVHLRPYGTRADDQLPTADLRVYKLIGQKATELTGYPAASVFHEFRYDPKDNITGVADDWAYEHLGIFAWTTEFWAPLRDAGITDYKFIEWYDEHPFEDDLKLMAWNDEKLGGKGFVDWYPFEHPQLGPVELGGWHSAHCWRNPPPDRLEAEVAPHSEWAIWHCLISPVLRVRSIAAERLGADGEAWRIRLVVENAGYLPTNVTEKAKERKAVRPLEAEVVGPDGVDVIGERKLELGQLGGRALKRAMVGANDPTRDRAKAEWVVRAAAGTEVRVEARHQRAGVVRASVVLGG